MKLNRLFGCGAVLVATNALSADPESALPRSTPEAQGISSGAILSFVDRVERQVDVVHSFMLLRHGHVVAEGWWAPYGPDRVHELHSLSKSFTSTAIGFAVDEGLISLDDPMVGFFPESVPPDAGQNLRDIRIRQLLNMTTGQEEGTDFYELEDWISAFMASDFPHKPGTHWVYNSSASFMLSAIIQEVTGQTVCEFLTPRLFEPLGIEGIRCETNPRGINPGGWGMFAKTGDIAKLGQFYLQRGNWNGEQLLSEAWVDQATSRQASNGCFPDSDWDQGYGFQFWMCRHGLYRGDGAFGQFCIVMPEQDAVLAITSGATDMGAVMNAAWDTLLPAMENDQPLIENAELSRVLQERLAGLELPVQTGAAHSPLMEQVGGKVYRIEENPMGIVAASLIQDGGIHVLTLQTEEGEQPLPAGSGSWLESVSNFSTEGPTPTAASCGWLDENTFAVTAYLLETAYRLTEVVGFEGNTMTISMEQNVGFGSDDPTLLRGTLVVE